MWPKWATIPVSQRVGLSCSAYCVEAEAQPCSLEPVLQSHRGVHNIDHPSCNKYCACENCACVFARVCFCVCAPVCVHSVHALVGVNQCSPRVCVFFLLGSLAFQTVSTSENLSHLFFQENKIRVAHPCVSCRSGHLFWLRMAEREAY